MLISFDVKGLEVVCAAYLSKDSVLTQELLNGVDLHADNQQKFGLPSRYISKRFKFKLLYGGTPFGFSTDPEFLELGYSPSRWETVVSEYYAKYRGIEQWHKSLIQEVLRTGRIVNPTGREYDYSTLINTKPEWYYVPKIKNYPVQGLGADLMMVARISLYRRMKRKQCKSLLVNTIHDSIVIDAPINEIRGVDESGNSCYNIVTEVENVFRELPKNIEKAFNIKWHLPILIESKQLNGESINV